MVRLLQLEGPIVRRSVASDSPSRTRKIGRRLGELIPAGTVISLGGGLGAGKTLMAKGICAGLGVDEEVVSPSFILVEEYRGVFPVLHFDLYRLDELGEVEDVGLFEAIDGRNVVLVEWGDRLPAGTIRYDVRVHLVIRDAAEREIRLEAPARLIDAVLGA
ncbi:MAG TPA: tRNA (adenosine(37)-N6)-threonylcarbamoyltransferase complex ATPase subunit type 1 TsaE [Patescibacteria group bacterium]|nr:tRNA (adenosine(37)-N6)-threonylcarbamoyltransferase complex ATPase subunit type 1 TsaE [Patescibacteria group bacterium]